MNPDSVWVRRRSAIVSVTLAIGVHFVALVTLSAAHQFGAEDEGEDGIEVGLGLQQIIADSPPEEVEEIEEEEPPPEPIEEPVEPPPVVEPIEPEPVVVPENQVIERSDLTNQPTVKHALNRDRIALNKPRSTPSQVGSGRGEMSTFGGNPRARITYISRVAARLNRYKTYPIEARRAGLEGVVTLRLELDEEGQVLTAEILQSADVEALDIAALLMVERAEPFPPFPRSFETESMKFAIPVTFQIR